MTVKADVAKRIAELVDGDAWQIADLLVDEFPVEDYGDNERGMKTGLHAELEQYETLLAAEFAVELKASTMRHYRATAIAWPDGERSTSASFTAHAVLRGPNRAAEMRRYLRQNHGKPLSARAVRRFRSEDRPSKPAPPWEAQVRRSVESLAKRLVLGNVVVDRDDWWNARPATPNRRATVVAALRAVASNIASADR